MKVYLAMTADVNKPAIFYERILMNEKSEALKKIQLLIL